MWKKALILTILFILTSCAPNTKGKMTFHNIMFGACMGGLPIACLGSAPFDVYETEQDVKNITGIKTDADREEEAFKEKIRSTCLDRLKKGDKNRFKFNGIEVECDIQPKQGFKILYARLYNPQGKNYRTIAYYLHGEEELREKVHSACLDKLKNNDKSRFKVEGVDVECDIKTENGSKVIYGRLYNSQGFNFKTYIFDTTTSHDNN